ncbi:874_t:CDS:10 [Funneliformis geosporum]|nr:874_t:CDS:10 [Funneliformis geosporum]
MPVLKNIKNFLCCVGNSELVRDLNNPTSDAPDSDAKETSALKKINVLDPVASDGKYNIYSCSSRYNLNIDINKLTPDSNAKETSEPKISNDSDHERTPTSKDTINDLDPEKTPKKDDGPALNTATFVLDGIQTTTDIILPFISFLPLIKEVAEVFNEIVEIYQSAEHNKKICGILLDRVQIADTALRNLKNRRDKNENFFSKSLSKYIQAKSIESNVKEFSSEFDSTIQSLHFSLAVDFSIRAEQDNKDIKSDIDDLTKYLDEIGSGVTDGNHKISAILVQLSALNKSLSDAKFTNTDDVFKSELLDYNDFEEQERDINRNLKNVYKFRRRKHGLNDYVALKLVPVKNSSSEEDKDNFRKQVTILKKLKPCDCIIQYIGLTAYDDKFYLVTEWAEYGNLREYYQNYPLDVKLKLRFALDIAKGLNFLSSALIVHRDIRAENILITDHETAKIANFQASRAVNENTKNHAATLEAIRYCAPEKLENRTKYDTKCEVYSFGILLWEIAEKKIPYEKYDDITVIQELVCAKKYREPFSLGSLPREYQDIAKKAVHPDYNLRPQFSKIFTILQELYQKDGKLPPSPRIPPEVKEEKNINFAEFNYMSVDEAVKNKSNRELSYKCFEAYALLNDIKAKYYKAYYIQQNYVELDMDQPTKDKLVADLYKEVADSGDPEAQLRYGNCLIKGIGVKKDLKQAAEYFTKAAENGQSVGMFNAASLYLSDKCGIKDEALGEKYMRLAAYKQHKQAIDYFKKRDWTL